MKKRMLSTLLTLGMLLTLTPAVSAEVPEGSAGDIPEETCKVEYKEQSDGIEIQTEKDSNNIIHLDITINETAPSNVVLDFRRPKTLPTCRVLFKSLRFILKINQEKTINIKMAALY